MKMRCELFTSEIWMLLKLILEKQYFYVVFRLGCRECSVTIQLFHSIFSDLQPEEERVSASPVHFENPQRTSRQWTPIDNFNPQWMEQLNTRDTSSDTHDYLKENKVRLTFFIDTMCMAALLAVIHNLHRLRHTCI